MDNTQAVLEGQEAPSMEPLKARKFGSAGDGSGSRATESAVERVASAEEKGSTADGPINLRDAKEGLDMGLPSRPSLRLALETAPREPHRRADVKNGAFNTAPVKVSSVASASVPERPVAPHRAKKAPLHAAPAKQPAPGPLASTSEAGSAVKPAEPKGEGAVKEDSAKPRAREKKAPSPKTAASSATAEPVAEGPKCDLQAPRRKLPLLTLISYSLLAIVLLAGWFYSGEEIITAKEGTGYIIGIVGGAMMLLLILYPLRKTARWMRRMGPIKQWFRAHMILGLVGPALILFHANFAFGSLNSTVAMVAMLLVAGSGLVGRYIYAKIHYGLYGKEMNLNELQKDFENKANVMRYILDYAPTLQKRIKDFDELAVRPHYSFCGSLLCLARSFFAALRLRLVLALGLRRTLRIAALRNQWSAAERKAHSMATHRYISNHISAAMAIARFKVYERLFSLWHILHLPLFLMLVLTAIIHVIAVHMF